MIFVKPICDNFWITFSPIFIIFLLYLFGGLQREGAQIRFKDKVINWRTTINLIISQVSLLGNLTSKIVATNIYEFTIMKACNLSKK